MTKIYLPKSEYEKIPETLQSVYHPNPNNYQNKSFEGQPSITLNATHRKYVIGREIEIVDNVDNIPADKIGTIITCKSCGEISIADKTNPTLCPYCAGIYRTSQKMPEKKDMPENLQKVAALTELSTMALQKAHKRALKAGIGKEKGQLIDIIGKKQFVYRFYLMIAERSWILQNFMSGHSANFSDDQRQAAYAAANELNSKLEREPGKYAKAYRYYKKYVLDGIPVSTIAFQDNTSDSKTIRSAITDFVSDLLADDWQLRFIMGYGAANQAIQKACPKRNKSRITEADVATKLISKILDDGNLYKYVVPVEKRQTTAEPTASAIAAETEKVCNKLLNAFYKTAFIVHPYIEDPIHARSTMTPCWQLSEHPKQGGKNAYDISIPNPARENLYTLSIYLLSCFLSIYCFEHNIPDSSEKVPALAEKHGLKVENDESGSVNIVSVNEKVLAVLDAQSWPKWLYFCVRDCREKKIIDDEKEIKGEILHHLAIADITLTKPARPTGMLAEQRGVEAINENKLEIERNAVSEMPPSEKVEDASKHNNYDVPASSAKLTSDIKQVVSCDDDLASAIYAKQLEAYIDCVNDSVLSQEETHNNLPDDEASELYTKQLNPYLYPTKTPVPPDKWMW